jgi:hypothetical protein
MTGRIVKLAAATMLLAAAGDQPATLAPPVTGSMYNGNNAHAADLPQTGQPSPASQPKVEVSGQGATGANIQGGHGAAQGGGS